MTQLALFVVASTRDTLAEFIRAFVIAYTIVIFAYILMQLYMTAGGSIPYSSWSRRIMDFLSETTEPYLRIFGKFIRPVAGIDLSAVVGVIVLQVVGNIVASLVAG